LQVEFPGRDAAKPVLLLGHLDTRWPLGTLTKTPFKMEGGRACGPGVLDMKAGIVMMMFALDALRGINCNHRSVSVLLDTDEEDRQPV
jgi:glutamate carboxypeptidase